MEWFLVFVFLLSNQWLRDFLKHLPPPHCHVSCFPINTAVCGHLLSKRYKNFARYTKKQHIQVALCQESQRWTCSCILFLPFLLCIGEPQGASATKDLSVKQGQCYLGPQSLKYLGVHEIKYVAFTIFARETDTRYHGKWQSTGPPLCATHKTFPAMIVLACAWSLILLWNGHTRVSLITT